MNFIKKEIIFNKINRYNKNYFYYKNNFDFAIIKKGKKKIFKTFCHDGPNDYLFKFFRPNYISYYFIKCLLKKSKKFKNKKFFLIRKFFTKIKLNKNFIKVIFVIFFKYLSFFSYRFYYIYLIYFLLDYYNLYNKKLLFINSLIINYNNRFDKYYYNLYKDDMYKNYYFKLLFFFSKKIFFFKDKINIYIVKSNFIFNNLELLESTNFLIYSFNWYIYKYILLISLYWFNKLYSNIMFFIKKNIFFNPDFNTLRVLDSFMMKDFLKWRFINKKKMYEDYEGFEEHEFYPLSIVSYYYIYNNLKFYINLNV